MKRIVVLTRYNQQFASARVRYLQYAEKWKSSAIIVVTNILFNQRYSHFINNKDKLNLSFLFFVLKSYFTRIYFVLFKVKKGDLVFIQLEILPMFPSIMERYLRWRKIPFVIDFDDAFFDFYEKSENVFVKFFLRNKFSNIVSTANWNITGSIYLTQYARQRSRNVTEIPTSVQLEDYLISYQKDNNVFTIGWIGSASTSKFIDDISKALLDFIEKHNCVLLLIGYEGSLLINHPNIKNLPWKLETEVLLLKQIDLGVMPLRNDGFSLGKCGFKLIQYMACQKPFIASPLPANINIDGGIGNLFASNEVEWYNAIKKVYGNRSYFKKIGVENFIRVQEHYSIEANYCKYLKIFDAIYND